MTEGTFEEAIAIKKEIEDTYRVTNAIEHGWGIALFVGNDNKSMIEIPIPESLKIMIDNFYQEKREELQEEFDNLK